MSEEGLEKGGPFEVTYVGGPLNGEIRLCRHLGTTWSMQVYRDEAGKEIGYYIHQGPGHLTTHWQTVEERRALWDDFNEQAGRWFNDREKNQADLEDHVKRMMEAQNDD